MFCRYHINLPSVAYRCCVTLFVKISLFLVPLQNFVAWSEDTAFSFWPAILNWLQFHRCYTVKRGMVWSRQMQAIPINWTAVSAVNMSWKISEWSWDDPAKVRPQRTEAKVGYVLKVNILTTVMMFITTPAQVRSVGPCQTAGEYGIVTHGCDELGLSWWSDLIFVTRLEL